jgi:acetyltransferase-like isoleucine patch superfamily enzyme
MPVKRPGIKYSIARMISAGFLVWYQIRYRGRVQFGKNILVNHRFIFRGKGRLMCGDNVNLWAHAESNRFLTYSIGAVIEVASGVRLNGVLIHCAQSVKIKEQARIGSAILMDTDMHCMDKKGHVLEGHVMVKPIVIGKGVWIGGQTAVMKGVHIGEHSVVAFRGVVVKSVEANTLVGGNPAIVLKKK